MSPRKKPKPNHPQAPAAVPVTTSANDTTSHDVLPSDTLNKKASRKWLGGGGGSWRSKAPAVVMTAKESIGVTGGATAELLGDDASRAKEDSPKKFLSKRKSSKGDAIPASITQLNVSSTGSVDTTQTQDPDPNSILNVASSGPSDLDKSNDSKVPTASSVASADDPPLPPNPPVSGRPIEAGTFGWRSWWSRPDGYADSTKAAHACTSDDTNDAQKTPLPGTTPSEELDQKDSRLGNHFERPKQDADQDTEMKDGLQQQETAGQKTGPENVEIKDVEQVQDKSGVKNNSGTSWFWLWSNAQNAQTNPAAPSAVPTVDSSTTTSPDLPGDQKAIAAADIPSHDDPSGSGSVDNTGGADSSNSSRKPSGWAFWFRDKPNSEEEAQGAQKQVGEVAVFDTPSQTQPEAAQFNEEQQQPMKSAGQLSKPAVETSVAKRPFPSLRGRAKVKDSLKRTPINTPELVKAAEPAKVHTSDPPIRDENTSLPHVPAKPSSKAKEEPPNLVLPEFINTYHLVQKPTYWQQIRQYFLGEERAMPHLHINPAPPRIKKAVTIGIHGYFPAPIFQRVLGQPTGTSIRFANAARAAVEDWTRAQGYSADIEQIALEGEGFIAERVNTLWKLLLNWIDHIKAADFILIACHSQGVPVAMMLVAKLIQFGCVNSARIGVCAMAGVNMGPFADYKTKYFGPTAAELFEFGNPKSLVSQMYLAALDEVLRYGVRILYIGSIDDQLVSLESSTFSVLSHPYIYRAVFVDGRIHAPDFLTHLVGFALKLRNLGLPDHGLIRELSPALAGSLYGGEGHSRVYEDPRVYHLAIQHALETTTLPVVPLQQRPSTSASLAGLNIPVPGAKLDEKDIFALRVGDYEAVGSGSQNPFFLPWAMRGLLEEDFVKKELGQEVEQLLSMFEDWRPTGKQLKDVKFRLDGVRSKL